MSWVDDILNKLNATNVQQLKFHVESDYNSMAYASLISTRIDSSYEYGYSLTVKKKISDGYMTY